MPSGSDPSSQPSYSNRPSFAFQPSAGFSWRRLCKNNLWVNLFKPAYATVCPPPHNRPDCWDSYGARTVPKIQELLLRTVRSEYGVSTDASLFAGTQAYSMQIVVSEPTRIGTPTHRSPLRKNKLDNFTGCLFPTKYQNGYVRDDCIPGCG